MKYSYKFNKNVIIVVFANCIIYLKKKAITISNFYTWRPDLQVVAEIGHLFYKQNVSADILLSISSLIHTYCKLNPNCNLNIKLIEDVTYIEQKIKENCLINENRDEVIIWLNRIRKYCKSLQIGAFLDIDMVKVIGKHRADFTYYPWYIRFNYCERRFNRRYKSISHSSLQVSKI